MEPGLRTTGFKRARNPFQLRPREPLGQLLAARGGGEQTLAAIGLAGLLRDIAFIDQLLQDPPETLFGDLQYLQQVSDPQAGVTIDKVKHAMMRPAKTYLLQNFVRLAGEITIGEEQQLRQLEQCCIGLCVHAPPLVQRG